MVEPQHDGHRMTAVHTRKHVFSGICIAHLELMYIMDKKNSCFVPFSLFHVVQKQKHILGLDAFFHSSYKG